jgi:hypothetical protein
MTRGGGNHGPPSQRERLPREPRPAAKGSKAPERRRKAPPGARNQSNGTTRTPNPRRRDSPDPRATATDPPGPNHGEGRLRAPRTAAKDPPGPRPAAEGSTGPDHGDGRLRAPRTARRTQRTRTRGRTPSGAPNRATDHEPRTQVTDPGPEPRGRTPSGAPNRGEGPTDPNHGNRTTGPRATATDPPGPEPRGKAPSGVSNRGNGPTGPTTRSRGIHGPRPRGRTPSGAPNRATDPQRTWSHRQPKRHRPPGRRPDGTGSPGSGTEGRGAPPRRRGNAFRKVPPGTLQTRPSLGAPEPSGSASRGAGSAATSGWPASRRQGRTPRGPLARRTHSDRSPSGPRPDQAMHRTRIRPASAGRRSARIPGQSSAVPRGRRGPAARHSSERRREGIRTSLGPSPREYRAVRRWKRRRARNGLCSGAKP